MSGRWVLLCWALAAAFFGVSVFYAMQGSVSGWLIWGLLSIVWLYTAVVGTTKYLKRNMKEQL